MNSRDNIKVIDPKKVAEKLADVSNFLQPIVQADMEKLPRLREALWFLQYVSIAANYPGGLARFTHDFITDCASEFGPVALLSKDPGELNAADVREICGAFPSHICDRIFGEEYTSRNLGWMIENDLVELSDEEIREHNLQRAQSLCSVDYTLVQSVCIDAAREDLEAYFLEACTDPGTSFLQPTPKLNQVSIPGRNRFPTSKNRLWYCPRVWELFFAWIDRRADLVKGSLGETSITREVFRWFQLAEQTRKGVMLIGDSRHGKTEAIRAYANIYPGRVRIIETPSTSAEGDLLREIARALGISHQTAVTSFHTLRADIDLVLRQSQIMLAFDEFQFLLPRNASRRSDPPRLNYVRRAIMDIGLPTAFICTPQNWSLVEKNFLKLTGYNFDQFQGRLLRSPVVLPDALPVEEMVDVASKHFPPDMDRDVLEYVSSTVRGFQGSVLSCIESVALLSKIYATESGRLEIAFADVERALADAMPSKPSTTQTRAVAQPPRASSRALSTKPKEASFSQRSTAPAPSLVGGQNRAAAVLVAGPA